MTTLPLAGRGAVRIPRWGLDVGFAVLVVALYLVFRDTAVLPHDEDHTAFDKLNGVRDWVDENRNSSPIFLYVVNYVRIGIGDLFDALQSVLHGMGWLGVTATAGAIGGIFAGWRIGVLATAGFLVFGVVGLWEESVDTLALTITAVLLSLLVGIPLGVLAGRSATLQKLLNPVLDVMQIMPTFAYLAPMALFFQIGAPSATVATMIYAIPPAIRITALAVRQVPAETVEAAESLGSTRWQTLFKVQLPMAKPTIVLAINQTIMMAMSMVVITALINAPGLGVTIIQALEQVNVGMMVDASLAIVVMAIVLDRMTRGISTRTRRGGDPGRRYVLAGGAAAVVAAIVLGRATSQDFPSDVNFRFAPYANDFVDWVERTFGEATKALQDAVANGLLNPLQDLLTSTPWWLVLLVVFGIATRVSGPVPALTAAACLAAIAAIGLWDHAMQTLTTVLVATVLTLAVGVLFGVLAARSDVYAAIQRPMLDAAQTMPSFVYLLPALALFGPGRFTAVVASVIYAAPPVIRLVEDGIRGVPATVVEAATAAGSTPGQLLWKVQLPMARRALLLAANQGIIMVLAMVVVGGLVGAGALGFDVVSGFSQSEDFGKGLAAGVAIVLLGVMLDRITQGAGDRSGKRRAWFGSGQRVGLWAG